MTNPLRLLSLTHSSTPYWLVRQRDVDDFKYRQRDHAQLASHSLHVVSPETLDLTPLP